MSIEKTPEELVAGFVSLLSVTREGDDAFSGLKQPNGVGRVFGGQVIAQALQAAQATGKKRWEAFVDTLARRMELGPKFQEEVSPGTPPGTHSSPAAK